jgi:Dolichyl-phosphate-mannose-protein mannosyltransferase
METARANAGFFGPIPFAGHWSVEMRRAESSVVMIEDRNRTSVVTSHVVEASLRDSRGPRARSSGVGRSERVWVAGGSAILFAWFVGLSAARGVLGAARNDDWAYYRIAFRFVATGRFQLDHWTQALLLGQVVGAWPIVRLFGPSIAALQLSVAAIGCVGVALVYLCVRRLLDVRMALIAVVPLALGPLFGALAVSFMTDVPSLALQVTAIYLSIRAIESGRRATLWWVAAMVAGACAFSVREYAAATFAAVAVAAVSTAANSSQRALRLGFGALFAGAMVDLYVWRHHHLAGNFDTTVQIGLRQFQHGQSYLLSLSLLLLPACWMVSWRRLGRLIWVGGKRTNTLTILAVVLITLAVGHRQVLGNYVTPTGYANPPAVQALVPAAAWRIVLLIGATAEATIVALVALTAAARAPRARRGRDATDQVRRLFAWAVVVGIAGQLMLVLFSDSPAFDRYLIVFLPFGSSLIIDTARRWDLIAFGRGRLPAAIAVVAYVAVGTAYVDRAAQYDGAVWRLGNSAVAAGYDPTTIDAGYAWIGYHQPGVDAWPGAPNPAFWRHPTRPRCVVVSFRPTGHPVPEHTISVVRTASPPGHSQDLVATLGPDHCSPGGRGHPSHGGT